MIKTDIKSMCCGCGVCSLVCPQKCISLKRDTLGHYYAKVDKSKCIGCSMCERVCPIQKEFFNTIGIKAYAAYSKDTALRHRGSSGGMFETLSRAILQDNGVVFGAKFDNEMQLKCCEAKTSTEVKALTKSKYLQSDCKEAFPVMKKRIIEGKKVLFCSTPCQVAAFRAYLGTLAQNDNVYLIDFFCHGVPSQHLFDKCRRYVEKTKDIKIKDFEFRTKIKNGATPHYYTLIYEKNGRTFKKTSIYTHDPFYLGFQKYITLRDSCYKCPYGYGNHSADITIGDFHEVDKYICGINRFDGISTVLINTEKGQMLWNLVQKSLITYDIDISKLYADKQIYCGGTKVPEKRDEFLQDIETMNMKEIVDKWFNCKNEWKKDVYYNLPKVMRDTIKRFAKLDG